MARQVKLLRNLSLIVIAALVITFAPALSVIGEEVITLTTIMPSQDTLRVKRGAVGLTYKETATLSNEDIGDDNLLIEGNVGIGTTDPEFRLTLDGGGGILAKGWSGQVADLTTSGWGTRLIWHPKKAAFRAGIITSESVLGTEWDDANIGVGSVAFGKNTMASGDTSIALGYSTTASGNRSLAAGRSVTAGADDTIVLGRGVSDSNNLVNNTASSLMVGFNSDIPTLFVGPSAGAGTTGNVGIGTTGPGQKLQVSGNVLASAVYVNNTEYGVEMYTRASGDYWTRIKAFDGFEFKEGRTDVVRMVIEKGGNVGIGTTNPGYQLDVAGTAHASSHPSSSDARFKKDVVQLTNALEKIEHIRGISFNWNELYESSGRASGHREIGIIGQEVEKIFPELITTWGDENYRAVDYGRLTGVLIEAIKELKTKIETLEARLNARQ